VAIDTFITELSSVIRNWAEASVASTVPDVSATRSVVVVTAPPSDGSVPQDRRGRASRPTAPPAACVLACRP
jgi:hypothetical protein